MNRIVNSSVFLLLIITFVSFVSLSFSQCLTDNDDLSQAKDTDLLSIQEFNLELFRRILPKNRVNKNFVFSPYSVWNSLVLAYLGSAGKTQRQFEKVLRVTDKISTLRKWRQLEYMYLGREETSVNNTFVLSNRAYFDTSVGLRRCVEDILHNELQKLELINDPSGSADIINKFVNDMTRGHIKQLVAPMDIMFAYMVLVNAAFFKGNWKSTFDEKYTKNVPFNTLNGLSIDVPMMTQSSKFNYGFDDAGDYEILELPYVGDTISMYIFLPYKNNVENFYGMINSFTAASLENNFKNMYYSRMQVFLPKFSIDTVVEDELVQALYRMGLRDAFIAYKANFTDFTFNKKIKLDKGIHKAFIEVNEEGTEAGAATAFITNKIGGNSMFVCNRPFAFVIRDKETRNILFTGAFLMPDAQDTPYQGGKYLSPLAELIPGIKG